VETRITESFVVPRSTARKKACGGWSSVMLMNSPRRMRDSTEAWPKRREAPNSALHPTDPSPSRLSVSLRLVWRGLGGW